MSFCTAQFGILTICKIKAAYLDELKNPEVNFCFSSKPIQPCRLCPLVAAEAEDRSLLVSVWAEGRHLINEWRSHVGFREGNKRTRGRAMKKETVRGNC